MPPLDSQPTTRHRALADKLLAAPDPMLAVAHQLADTDARVDALCRRLHETEQKVNYATKHLRALSEGHSRHWEVDVDA